MKNQRNQIKDIKAFKSSSACKHWKICEHERNFFRRKWASQLYKFLFVVIWFYQKTLSRNTYALFLKCTIFSKRKFTS